MIEWNGSMKDEDFQNGLKDIWRDNSWEFSRIHKRHELPDSRMTETKIGKNQNNSTSRHIVVKLWHTKDRTVIGKSKSRLL